MCPVPHAYNPIVGQRYADPKSLPVSHPIRKQQEDTYTHLWPLHARACMSLTQVTCSSCRAFCSFCENKISSVFDQVLCHPELHLSPSHFFIKMLLFHAYCLSKGNLKFLIFAS